MLERIRLTDGSTSTDPRLDRIYEEDWRSLLYRVAEHPDRTGVDPYKAPRSYTWPLGIWLDQRSDGACVSFTICHELAAFPVRVSGLSDSYARDQYFEMQKRDPWPGGAYPGASPQYEGTAVLTGMKVMQEAGYFTSYYWGVTTREAVLGIGYTGPAVLGLHWYSGMFDVDPDGYIAPSGYLAGGHAILALGVTIRWRSWINRFVSRTWDNVDLDRSYLTLHNSWGRDWGRDGRARLRLRDFDRLLNEQGEAAFPLRNAAIRDVSQAKPLAPV